MDGHGRGRASLVPDLRDLPGPLRRFGARRGDRDGILALGVARRSGPPTWTARFLGGVSVCLSLALPRARRFLPAQAPSLQPSRRSPLPAPASSPLVRKNE